MAWYCLGCKWLIWISSGHPTGQPGKGDGWMDELGFYVPSTVFQSFRDDGRVNMKGSVQWSAVSPWSEVGSANRSATRMLRLRKEIVPLYNGQREKGVFIIVCICMKYIGCIVRVILIWRWMCIDKWPPPQGIDHLGHTTVQGAVICDPACCLVLDSFHLVDICLGIWAPYRGGILQLGPY